MSETRDPDLEFVQYLARLADERNPDPHRRGVLAALRRGLGKAPGQAPEMHRYVVRHLPEHMSEAADRAYYLVASLFAWHTRSWIDADPWRSNLGGSFARIDAAGEMNPSIERRFMALLSCDAERLPYHLRQAIGLLRTRDIPVNWRQLLRDLRRWDDPERLVQRRWARAFWGARPALDVSGDADPQALEPNMA